MNEREKKSAFSTFAQPSICTFVIAVEGARGLEYLLTVKAYQLNKLLPSMGTDSADRAMNSRTPGEANEWLGAAPKMGEKKKVKVLRPGCGCNIVVFTTVH